ncbi:MAG: ABC transporter ATP-binding protein [Candidatus Aenigmatarchaeota archaeon]|nr:ABC transporter ATP-binding protein [Candidatus Aenigmarchaeota archaeon]
MKSVIELENVNKVYQLDSVQVSALNNVNLKIKRKDFVSIMGPSGSGKSTLLHLMGALDKPTSGKVYIDGIDLSKLTEPEIARIRGEKIGFVFQFFNLHPTLTALENVELPMMIMERDRDERRQKAMELLELVGLKERAEHLPSQLSGGERQRVSIARALANNPSFILADEPTGNLDSKAGKEIMELFVKINNEGKTVIVVTHETFIASHSKHIIKIKDGRIVGG